MRKSRLIMASALIALSGIGGWYLGGIDEKTPTAVEAEHGSEDSTVIAPDAAASAGIKTEAAAEAQIEDTVALTGRILLNQNTTAQVKARFPGIVREVRKGQGESVKRDDILALIESNDSLQVYAVKSPLDGVILSRNTNVGDVAGEQPVFIIANLENVWAEFHIFPRDMARIRNGQTVNVSSFEGKAVGRAPIAVLSPVAESSSQTIVARVTLPNADKNLHSGMTVHGDVVIDSREAKVAVRSSAIQRMENKPVVFVRENDSYVMRPVRTGIADEQWTEILEGLSAGELYVSENSFLVKADIGKAGAAHED